MGGEEKEKKYYTTYYPFHFVINCVLIPFFSLSLSLSLSLSRSFSPSTHLAFEWGSWEAWGSCDVTCGPNGRRRRERQCLSYPSRERSNRCSGDAVQVGRCPLTPCPSKTKSKVFWFIMESCTPVSM